MRYWGGNLSRILYGEAWYKERARKRRKKVHRTKSIKPFNCDCDNLHAHQICDCCTGYKRTCPCRKGILARIKRETKIERSVRLALKREINKLKKLSSSDLVKLLEKKVFVSEGVNTSGEQRLRLYLENKLKKFTNEGFTIKISPDYLIIESNRGTNYEPSPNCVKDLLKTKTYQSGLNYLK